MTYCDVVCFGCKGDLECPNCSDKRLIACKNCGVEISVPDRVAQETFDPEAVRKLIDTLLDCSFGLPRQLIADAQAIRESERT